jgi:hypothetical protein
MYERAASRFRVAEQSNWKNCDSRKHAKRQVTGRGPSSRGNARDLKRFLPEFTLSLAEGVEMTKRVSLCAWRPFDFAAMWMSSPLHTRPLFFFFLHDSFTSRPKRDLLLCVARHRAVTLTRNAPLSKAQSPGISVSRIEPSGVFLSRFSKSSSRSLGRCLLLGQRS